MGKKTGPNPTDRAKQGTKRSLVTEASGVPIGVAVQGANCVDFKMVRETLQSIVIDRPEPTAEAPQGMCMDKGYDYDEVLALLEEFGFTAHVRTRGEEAKAKKEAGQRARRWVVERTHSWFNRYRRLLVRWEKKACNYLAIVHLACGLITFQRSGLLG